MDDDLQVNNNQQINVITTESSKPSSKSHKLAIAVVIVLVIIVVGYISYTFNIGGFKTTTRGVSTSNISKSSPKPIIYTPLIQLISMSNPYENGYINNSSSGINTTDYLQNFMKLTGNGNNYSSLTSPSVINSLIGMVMSSSSKVYKLFYTTNPITNYYSATNKSIAVYSSLPTGGQDITSYKYVKGVYTNTLGVRSGISGFIATGFWSYLPAELSNKSDNATINSLLYAFSFMQDGFDLYAENTLGITVKPVILAAAYYNDTLLVDLDGVSPEHNSSTSVYINGKKEPYTQYYSLLLLKTKLNKGNNSLYVNYEGYNLSAELFANPNLLESNIYSNLIDGNYTNTSYIGFSIPYHNLKISNISVQVLYINGSSKDITNLANETSITINDNITTHISSGEIQLNYFNTSNMIKVDGLTKYGPIQLINNFEGYISIT
jgi:hypothetical protein